MKQVKKAGSPTFDRKKTRGFTLLEMMLVLGIIGGIMTIAINYGIRQMAQQKRDKTAIQMQQILNAALAYYTSNGAWPLTCTFSSTAMNAGTNAPTPAGGSPLTSLSAAGYLPVGMTKNPYAYSYNIACDSVTGSVFYVIGQMPNRANALVVAGELPIAYISDANGNPSTSGTYITAQVAIPGQNLNNARSVNFVGVYHNGACVPMPACPGFNTAASYPSCLATNSCCISGTNCMLPQIMVTPASVSGLNDPSSMNAYAITSFTAYALGPATAANVMGCPYSATQNATPTSVVTPCSWGATGIPNGSTASPSGQYWRVCLQVVTEKGLVSSTSATGSPAWGDFVSMVVMTRCTPPNEPFGSDFNVYTQ